MLNKTNWEWHKEQHLGDYYTTFRSKPAGKIFREGPSTLSRSTPKNIITATTQKETDEPKNLVLSLIKISF
jgi:hypothetical protein